jgi:hypothetical protein
MALPLTKPKILPLAQERRRFQRVKVHLLGRYMLEGRREFLCQVVNMSPGAMALVAPMAGRPGERVIAYVDHLGRLEGKTARTIDNGFAMTISASPRKRDKLAAQLHLARQPAHSHHAGRPPPRPLRPAHHHRQDAKPRGAPYRRRFRGRIHPAAASRFHRRHRYRE